MQNGIRKKKKNRCFAIECGEAKPRSHIKQNMAS